MEIHSLNKSQFLDYLALVDEEIRIPGAETHAWDDFPLLLAESNRTCILGITEGDAVVAGLGFLVRQFHTSCGDIPIACIGSVVTRPDHRGRGMSKALQEEVLRRLDAVDVPLAVLWTDRPEVYRGRGFVPAGWEFHVDLNPLKGIHDLPAGFFSRPFAREDVPAVAALYERHPLRTRRLTDDSRHLYNMPGTRGFVVVGEGKEVVAAVFCGKGADFQGFIPEWSGPIGLVLPLMAEVARNGSARHVLVPPGGEQLAVQLAGAGGTVTATTAGHWHVVQPTKLSNYLQGAGVGAPADPGDAAAILGTVGRDGVVSPGALNVAVWGFDSV